MRQLLRWLLLLVLLFWSASLFGATGIFHELTIPGIPAGATEVVGGGDAFWFTEFDANRIGTFSRNGSYREFNIPTPDSGPRGITSSSEAIWFTEFKAGKIGKVTFDGVVTEYVIPSPQSGPWGIAPGFDGVIWFTEFNTNKIGRLARDGTVTEFVIPTPSSGPRGIGSGAFSSPCFTEFNANQVACMDGSGRIVERALPTPNSGPEAIANMTNNGDFWFTETLANRIGVIRFAHANSLLEARIEEFPIPMSASAPSAISADYYEGSAWFTEKSAGQIGSISADGRITEYPLTDRSSQPTGISFSFLLGAEMQLMFLESARNRLVEIQPDAVLVGGAGTSGSWQTEFRVANVESNPVTVFAGIFPRPTYVCGICTVPQILQRIPAEGSLVTRSDVLRLGGPRIVSVRVLEDGTLPSVRARSFNANAPGQSVDLPTVRLSRLTELSPSLLSFPGAVKSGAARSNLWLTEASRLESLDVVIELIDPDGYLVASRNQTLVAGANVYLVDIIASLGIASFPDGQLRVRKTSDRGLLWGYLATVDPNGALSIYPGLNP